MNVFKFLIISLFSTLTYSIDTSPSVARIYGRNGEICIASFIEKHKIITANHCHLSTYQNLQLDDDLDDQDEEFDEASLKGHNYSNTKKIDKLNKFNTGYIVVDSVTYSFISTGRIPSQYSQKLDYSINQIEWNDNIIPNLNLVNFNIVDLPEKQSKVYTKIYSNEDKIIDYSGEFYGFPKDDSKDRYSFRHTLKTTYGFSGAPIFDENNNLLSIVSGGLLSELYDYGPFVNDIIEDIKK